MTVKSTGRTGRAPELVPQTVGRTKKKEGAARLKMPDAPASKGKFPEISAATISQAEISQLAHNEHAHPHEVLGAHAVTGRQRATAVRALFPGVQEVTLVTVAPFGAAERFQRTPMNRLHDGGVFETLLPAQKKLSYHFEVKEADGFVRKVEDPYRFPPSVDDLGLYLFGEGTLEKTASLLGAREATINGTKGFAFTVWAPNAKRISVVGDFNEWDGRRNPMRELSGSGVFEIFIPELPDGERYMFEVLQRNGEVVRKSDPCAQRTSLRPATASVTNKSTHVWDDDTWLAMRAKTDPLKQAVSTCEVHLPSWKRGPKGEFLNYRKLADELVPYLKEHNYSHIELIGLAEHPFDGSWGYQVTGYYSPTARHGTPDDFKYFVDKMHQANIGVLYDFVPAHFPRDAHGLASFDGTHLFDHEDPRKGEHKDWGTQIFNYGRQEVRAFLMGSLLHMIDEYHLDGVRTDAVASMLYLDYSRNEGEWVPNAKGGNHNLEAIEFLQQVNKVLDAKYPGVMKIAEESTAFPQITGAIKDGGLGFDLKWNMGWMNDTLHWFERGYEGRKEMDGLTNSFLWAFSEKYVCALSHDEVTNGKKSLLEKMPGDDWQKFANLRLLYGWMWSYPGHKLLMMGQEFGQRGEWKAEEGLDFAAREHNGRHQGAAKLVADLNKLYQTEPALKDDQFSPDSMEMVSRDTHNVAVSILRRAQNEKDSILFVHNMTPEVRGEYRVGVDGPGKYREILNTDSAEYGGSDVKNAPVEAEAVPMHGKPYSISLSLPPLATLALKRDQERGAGRA
jgi:1,4-alpha-glucan branching enzyme